MDQVFLDANVLFSAAYTPDSRLRELWALDGVELVTSEFAVEEARRNLRIHSPTALPALDRLLEQTSVVGAVPADPAPLGYVELADKDVPILSAAVAVGCTHLLTGDRRHFEKLFGRTVAGVLVLTPSEYLKTRGMRG